MKKWVVSALAVVSMGGGIWYSADWYERENYRRDCIEHTNDGDQCLRGPAGWAAQRCWGVDAEGNPVGRSLPPGWTGGGMGDCIRTWLAHGK